MPGTRKEIEAGKIIPIITLNIRIGNWIRRVYLQPHRSSSVCLSWSKRNFHQEVRNQEQTAKTTVGTPLRSHPHHPKNAEFSSSRRREMCQSKIGVDPPYKVLLPICRGIASPTSEFRPSGRRNPRARRRVRDWSYNNNKIRKLFQQNFI